jgi:hypothetical protein
VATVSEKLAELLFTLGAVAGRLSDGQVYGELVAAMQADAKLRAIVVGLLTRLDDAMMDAESLQPVPAP